MAGMSRVVLASAFALALSVSLALAGEPSPLLPKDDHFVELPAPRSHVKRAPLGNDDHGTRFSLLTNRKWSSAKLVWSIHEGDPDSPNERLSQDYGHIWGAECIRGAQTVSLTREYWLPGPPKNLGATFQVTYRGAISDIKVFINGGLAFNPTISHVPDVGGPPLFFQKVESELTSLFKYGKNAIRIDATKAAGKSCRGGFPQKRLGLAVELFGDFAADLQTSESGHREIVRRIPLGTKLVAFPVRIGMRNLGPSGAYVAGVAVGVTTNNLVSAQIVPDGGGEFPEECELSSSKRTLDCQYGPWKPGLEHRLKVSVGIELPNNWQISNFTVGFGTGSPTEDPVTDNDGGSVTVHLCNPSSPNPECQ